MACLRWLFETSHWAQQNTDYKTTWNATPDHCSLWTGNIAMSAFHHSSENPSKSKITWFDVAVWKTETLKPKQWFLKGMNTSLVLLNQGYSIGGLRSGSGPRRNQIGTEAKINILIESWSKQVFIGVWFRAIYFFPTRCGFYLPCPIQRSNQEL